MTTSEMQKDLLKRLYEKTIIVAENSDDKDALETIKSAVGVFAISLSKIEQNG